MNPFFYPAPVAFTKGLAVIRVAVGLLLVYHGQEVFHPEIMKSYTAWDMFKSPLAVYFVYLGKSTELLAGILLTLGFLTRVAALLTIGTFLYITFFVGNGRFWYEDQHPFMFLIFGVLFAFSGPGAWSMDTLIFRKKNP